VREVVWGVARVKVYEDADHNPFSNHAGDVAEDVRSFIVME